MNGHRFCDNVCHRHALIQAGSGVLEDDLAARLQHFVVLTKLCLVAYIDAIVEDLTCGGLVDIHDTPGNGGLTGAGFAHKAEDLTLLQLEGHIIHRFNHGVFAQLKHMGKVLHIQKNIRHCVSLPSVILLWALWDQAARLPHSGCP